MKFCSSASLKTLSCPQFSSLGLKRCAVIWPSFDYYCCAGSELVFRIPKFKEKHYISLPVNSKLFFAYNFWKFQDQFCIMYTASLPTLLQIIC